MTGEKCPTRATQLRFFSPVMAPARASFLLGALLVATAAGSALRAPAPAPAAAPSGPTPEEILTGPMKLSAPEQGYQGEPVEHKDMETYLSTYDSYYGPKAEHVQHPGYDVIGSKKR